MYPGTGARMGALEGLRTPVPVVPAAGEATGVFNVSRVATSDEGQRGIGATAPACL